MSVGPRADFPRIQRSPQIEPVDEAGSWTGVVPMFRAAGFEEIARRSPTGPVVMRRCAPGPEAPPV